jgi:hypothetical protein
MTVVVIVDWKLGWTVVVVAVVEEDGVDKRVSLPVEVQW